MADPKTTVDDFDKCSQDTLLSKIVETNEYNGRFCFILGSGASRESGIKTGKEMQIEWLQKIKEDIKKGKKDAKNYIEDKIIEINKKNTYNKISLDVDRLLSKDYSYPSEDYFPLFSIRFFPFDKNGYRYLEKELENSSASFGYYPLARILTETPNNVVISLNFDSLVEDSIFIYTKEKPLVVVHESLVRHIDLNQDRPIIAKIHRGLYFSPLNSPEDTNCLKEEWKESLKTIFTLYTPIFIGYGGGDASLMTFLKETTTRFENRLYWCYMNESDVTDEIKDIIKRHDGLGVQIAGFDDFMYHFGDIMDYNDGMPGNATKTLEEAAKARAEEFKKSFEKFNSKYGNIASLTEGEKQTAALLSENEKAYEESLTKAIKGNPDIAENYLYRGNIYYNLKQYDKALLDYNKVIELNPSDAVIYNNRGNTYSFLKNYEQALVDVEKALSMNQNSGHFYDTRAQIYNGLGEYDKAIDDCSKAIKLSPAISEHHETFAFALFNKGQFEKALDACNKSIELDPSSDTAKKLLEDINKAIKKT